MVLRFDKNRMLASAAACIAGCVVGVVLLLAVLDYADTPAVIHGAVLGGTVAAGLYGLVFLAHVGRAGKPVVTIDDRGVEFHRPEIGLIPWDRIEKAAVEKVLGSRRLSVYVRPPAPAPSLTTKLMYSLGAVKRGGSIRLAMIFGRFDASEAEVRAAIDRHRPAA